MPLKACRFNRILASIQAYPQKVNFKSRLHNSWPKVAKSGLPSQSALKADAFTINNCQPSIAYFLIKFTFTYGVDIILGWLTSTLLSSGLQYQAGASAVASPPAGAL